MLLTSDALLTNSTADSSSSIKYTRIFNSLHFIYPAVQNANAMCTTRNVQQSGGCSKVQSALTTAPCKAKEKTSENKKSKKQSDNADKRSLTTGLYVVLKK